MRAAQWDGALPHVSGRGLSTEGRRENAGAETVRADSKGPAVVFKLRALCRAAVRGLIRQYGHGPVTQTHDDVHGDRVLDDVHGD